MIVIKKTFILFSLVFFILISLVAVAAYTISARQINHSFIEHQLSIASETIRLRLASIVNSELALVRKLANTPVVREYFINPSDSALESLALIEFDTFMQHFELKMVFWVNDIDKIFYSTSNEPYIIDPEDPVFYWYDLTLHRTERYNFNINYNSNMQQIYLWINVPVFSEADSVHKYPVGMIGTGIHLNEFSDFIVNAYKHFDENIITYTFNKFDEITSIANYELVYNKVRLDEYLGETGTEILKVAHKLSEGEDYFFDYDGKIFLVGSIPEMDWFLSVSYPAPGLFAINQSMNTVFFSMLFLILFILVVINFYIARSETALEKQNMQLIEANKNSEIASRAKSDFLAAMSHELRTPLNTIIGFSEIELNKSAQDEKENISRIHQSGMHLLGIINDILDLSKLDSGKFEITPDEYNTASMINGAVDMNIIRIGSKHIQFKLEIGDDFPAKLIGDELRIRQIINNLLSNAIKYTTEGTIQLTVTYSEPEQGKVIVTFSVSDTGIGIQAEDIGKLFVNYTQLDTRTNREVEGTGLGLSISKQIAQMMDGDITVKSEYGKGSCFTAFIVQERRDASILGENTAALLRSRQSAAKILTGISNAAEKSASRTKASDTLQYKILAVDDHLNNLLLIREQLKPYGIQVDTASSGQEAMEKIQNMGESGSNSAKAARYDLILMDHMMPGMDGIETMKAIKKNKKYADVPIIVLTANALRGMREYYLEQGFTDFIAKPVNQQTLYEAIKKQLTLDKKPDFKRTTNTVKTIGTANTAGVIKTTRAFFSGEIIRQRIDILDHVCTAFEISAQSEAASKVIDSEYFRRLIELLEYLNSMKPSAAAESSSPVKFPSEQTALLIGAAQRKDTQTIRNTLKDCCKAFHLWAEYQLKSANNGSAPPVTAEIVQRLQKAIFNGDNVSAGKTIKELGTAPLTPAERERYFNIYDALMDDNNEKALERINEWLE